MNIDISKDPIGTGKDGKPVYLKDIWPSAHEVATTVGASVDSAMFKKSYAIVNVAALNDLPGEVFDVDSHLRRVLKPGPEEAVDLVAHALQARRPRRRSASSRGRVGGISISCFRRETFSSSTRMASSTPATAPSGRSAPKS